VAHLERDLDRDRETERDIVMLDFFIAELGNPLPDIWLLPEIKDADPSFMLV
jgi:hypothetical protein